MTTLNFGFLANILFKDCKHSAAETEEIDSVDCTSSD